MQLLLKECKSALEYFWILLRVAFKPSFSISQNILTFTFLAICAFLWILHWRFPNIASHFSILERFMALDWWQLSLMVLGGVFLIRLMISPYFVYREKEKALHELDQKHKDSNEKIKQLSDTAIAFEKELREMRIKFRRIEESKASDIPITLSKMHKFVKETEGKKKNSKHSVKIKQETLQDMLDLDCDSAFFREGNYSNPSRVENTMKKMKKHMGFSKKKAKPELIEKWCLKIPEAMDKHKMGLGLKDFEEYTQLEDELHHQMVFLSGTKLALLIDNFVIHLKALYSLKLIMDYGDAKTKIGSFPKYMKDELIGFEDKIERAMRSSLAQVNHILEKHVTGEVIE